MRRLFFLIATITLLVVAEPSLAATPKKPKAPPKPKLSTILQDKINGFVFTTSYACRNAFKVKSVPPSETNFGATYEVYLVGSRWWPRKVMWTTYAVIPQLVYDAIPGTTQPDKPDVILKLKKDNLLTQFYPQDKPRDFKCTLQQSVLP